MSSYNNDICSLLSLRATSVSRGSRCHASVSIVGHGGHGVLLRRARGCTSVSARLRRIASFSLLLRCSSKVRRDSICVNDLSSLLLRRPDRFSFTFFTSFLAGSFIDLDLGFLSWRSTIVMPGSMAAKIFEFVCLSISINISDQLLKSSILIVILMAWNISLSNLKKNPQLLRC